MYSYEPWIPNLMYAFIGLNGIKVFILCNYSTSRVIILTAFQIESVANSEDARSERLMKSTACLGLH